LAEDQKRRGSFYKTATFTDQVSLFSAKAVGGILMAMMVLTCADIFLRFFFSKSIVGSMEIEGNYFMAAVIFLPLAYGMTSRRGHIRVDIFTSHLPPRVRNGLELFGLILSFCVFGLVTVYGFAGTWRSWKAGETMVNIALPMWPGRACVVVGGALLCLQMLVKMVRLLKGSEEA
jgi:TRAP-type C4-dicarboxylate transport system permease small subunit